MTTTGYTDLFGRTVSGGLGAATSGQTYTLAGGTAAQYSVGSNVGSIAVNASGNWLGYVDRQTADFDLTGQVALSAVPATNQTLVGFTAKQTGSTSYYIGSLMVSSLAVMSLRISKVISGTLTTLTTLLVPGLGTYSAGTYFNIRFQCYWSNLLQANVLNIKIWAVGSTEPGGWLVSTTDNSITQYTSGTQAGLYARDEASSPGNTARFKNVVALSYGLPMPATTDPMCNDPAVAYPDQTALQSLAQAADTVMVGLDPKVSLAALWPRVRISVAGATIPQNKDLSVSFTNTEFNIGTNTNLGYDTQALYLPVGIWMVTFEVQLADATSFSMAADIVGAIYPASGAPFYMRSNPAHSNDLGVGGTGHFSALSVCTDPLTPNRIYVTLGGGTNSYNCTYAALTAIKISDYFS